MTDRGVENIYMMWAVDFLVASARDKIGRHSDCRELICILKNLEGKALTRVSLVLQKADGPVPNAKAPHGLGEEEAGD